MIIIMTIMQNTQIIITENHDYYLWVCDVSGFLELHRGIKCPFPRGCVSVRAKLWAVWQELGFTALSRQLSSTPGSWWDPAFLTQCQAHKVRRGSPPTPPLLAKAQPWVGVNWERAKANLGEEFKGSGAVLFP